MKLSELKTGDACSVLCEIAPLISKITQDETFTRVLLGDIDLDGKSTTERAAVIVNKIIELIPILVGTHRDDVFGILAAVNLTTEVEIANQALLVTMAQFRELLGDKELLSFFGLSKRQEKVV